MPGSGTGHEGRSPAAGLYLFPLSRVSGGEGELGGEQTQRIRTVSTFD